MTGKSIGQNQSDTNRACREQSDLEAPTVFPYESLAGDDEAVRGTAATSSSVIADADPRTDSGDAPQEAELLSVPLITSDSTGGVDFPERNGPERYAAPPPVATTPIEIHFSGAADMGTYHTKKVVAGSMPPRSTSTPAIPSRSSLGNSLGLQPSRTGPPEASSSLMYNNRHFSSAGSRRSSLLSPSLSATPVGTAATNLLTAVSPVQSRTPTDSSQPSVVIDRAHTTSLSSTACHAASRLLAIRHQSASPTQELPQVMIPTDRAHRVTHQSSLKSGVMRSATLAAVAEQKQETGTPPRSSGSNKKVGVLHAATMPARANNDTDDSASPSPDRPLRDATTADMEPLEAESLISSNLNNSRRQSVHASRHRYKPKAFCNGHQYSAFVRPDGRYNIEHNWSFMDSLTDLYLRDRFHALLNMNSVHLIILIFVIFISWMSFLSLGLWAVTRGDLRCIGSEQYNVFDYYFFVVETMFTIGFGSPRFPNCRASDWYVTIICVTGAILQALIYGIVFAKFAGSNSRRWAIGFSNHLCGTHNLGLKITTDVTDRSAIHETQDDHDGTINLTIGTPRQDDKRENSVPKPSNSNAKAEDLYWAVSFRVLNLTSQSFFYPKMSIYLLGHGQNGLSITQFPSFFTDVPLEFMELPTIVTVDNSCPDSPLHAVPLRDLSSVARAFEILVLLSFIDNRTGKTIEIRKSWSLDKVLWGTEFANIVSKGSPDFTGPYEVEVNCMNEFEWVNMDANRIQDTQ